MRSRIAHPVVAVVLSALVSGAAGCVEILGDLPDAVPSDDDAPSDAASDSRDDGASSDAPPQDGNALDGATPDAPSLAPTDPVEIALGEAHACVVLANHSLYCWGKNEFGETSAAPSGTTYTLSPAAVPWLGNGNPSYTHVTAGMRHTCATDTTRNVWCWGANDVGQIGNRTVDGGAVPTPARVYGDFSFVKVDGTRGQVAASRDFTCADYEAQGGTWCWGGVSPYLADAGWSPSMPTPIGLAGPAVGVSAALLDVCVALGTSPAQVWCVGSDKLGQIGNGTTNDTLPLTQASWDPEAGAPQSIASGITHTCALAANGRVYCWGSDGEGETGQPSAGPGDFTSVPTITTAFDSLPGTTTSLAVGGNETCVVRATATDAKVYCIGANESGQLGVAAFDAPDASIAHPTPIAAVAGIDDAVDVAVGGFLPEDPNFPPPVYGGFACAIRQDRSTTRRSVWCWGANEHGQLGNGNPTSFEASPVQVVGLPK